MISILAFLQNKLNLHQEAFHVSGYMGVREVVEPVTGRRFGSRGIPCILLEKEAFVFPGRKIPGEWIQISGMKGSEFHSPVRHKTCPGVNLRAFFRVFFGYEK
jgi:hypothetical protein